MTRTHPRPAPRPVKIPPHGVWHGVERRREELPYRAVAGYDRRRRAR